MAVVQSFSSLQPVYPAVKSLRGERRPFDVCKVRVPMNIDFALNAFQVRRLTVVTAYRRFQCFASAPASVPTVSDTKSAFLRRYSKPVPSVYNNVIQELLVQQHIMRYNQTYKYDAVFALGFVTVYEQLMDGYPTEAGKEAIFQAYIEALQEDPKQYREDAKTLEDWASSKTAETIVSFKSGDGQVDTILKDISLRASEGKFHYSRFFAIGLFRLLERANATDPAVLEKLCKELNISKLSVDRDLDVYRNLLSKLVQAKELLKEYVQREKAKQAEREANSKSSQAVAKMDFCS
ncbi:hypothetical protein KP509_33G011500 [Ceratopteris richardii]|uniref:Protein THYLAKOID FORMATION1, chloroplastic n=1 Tax=Ceratopteris richardii TaxID=49495 RepID=A0A8T2QMC4_CERRI|nr:hypothetical protein KP509_33G011500 [Ceratopteris richardii]KAH7285082.1 hypothetical protein KP509_33G011500 [Ceratopteris richardii]